MNLNLSEDQPCWEIHKSACVECIKFAKGDGWVIDRFVHYYHYMRERKIIEDKWKQEETKLLERV